MARVVSFACNMCNQIRKWNILEKSETEASVKIHLAVSAIVGRVYLNMRVQKNTVYCYFK